MPTGLEAELRALTDEELEARIAELLGVTGVKTRQESNILLMQLRKRFDRDPTIEKRNGIEIPGNLVCVLMVDRELASIETEVQHHIHLIARYVELLMTYASEQ
ncbi:MAG: hypothetical protein ACT4O2_10350 [Beijerinckiaceae bacterium]